MSRAGGDRGIDYDIEQLKSKYLSIAEGDRQATSEMYLRNKHQTEQDIKRLRDENADLLKRIAAARQASTEAESSRVIRKEHVRLDRLRADYDSMKSELQRAQQTLEQMKDEFQELSAGLGEDGESEDPVQRHVRLLENRLDKAMIKFNEAQSIRKTYEQIIKRLHEERLGFDAQTVAMEATLRAKHRDYEELMVLAQDAVQARQVAAQQRKQVRSKYKETKSYRDKDLGDAKSALELQMSLTEEALKRVRAKAEMEARIKGDLSKQEEEELQATVEMHKAQHEKMDQELSTARRLLEEFETAFAKIKETTGVSDVNEVIQKILSQAETCRSLSELTKENAKKVEMLRQARDKLRANVDELKYNISKTTFSGARAAIDSLQEQLLASHTELQRIKQDYEKATKVVVAGKAGVQHVATKLQHEESFSHAIVTDETLLEALQACEECLLRVQQRINDEQGSAAATTAAAEGEPEHSTHEGEGAALELPRVLREVQLEDVDASRPFNRRVSTPAKPREFDDSRRQTHDDEDDDDTARNKLKQSAQNLVDSRLRARKKQLRGGEEGAVRSPAKKAAAPPAAASAPGTPKSPGSAAGSPAKRRA